MTPFREGIEFYYNEDGLIVLTEKYHLERGYCCGNGCKHCPYNYDNVPEPRRSQLKARQKREDGPGAS
jgi:hypothetical protein